MVSKPHFRGANMRGIMNVCEWNSWRKCIVLSWILLQKVSMIYWGRLLLCITVHQYGCDVPRKATWSQRRSLCTVESLLIQPRISQAVFPYTKFHYPSLWPSLLALFRFPFPFCSYRSLRLPSDYVRVSDIHSYHVISYLTLVFSFLS